MFWIANGAALSDNSLIRCSITVIFLIFLARPAKCDEYHRRAVPGENILAISHGTVSEAVILNDSVLRVVIMRSTAKVTGPSLVDKNCGAKAHACDEIIVRLER